MGRAREIRRLAVRFELKQKKAELDGQAEKAAVWRQAAAEVREIVNNTSNPKPRGDPGQLDLFGE